MIITKYRCLFSAFRPAALVTAFGLLTAMGACDKDEDGETSSKAADDAKAKAAGIADKGPVDKKALAEMAKPVLPPLPKMAEAESNPFTEQKAELGRMLYYDTRLSKNRDISCNTCPALSDYGVDVRLQRSAARDAVLGWPGC